MKEMAIPPRISIGITKGFFPMSILRGTHHWSIEGFFIQNVYCNMTSRSFLFISVNPREAYKCEARSFSGR